MNRNKISWIFIIVSVFFTTGCKERSSEKVTAHTSTINDIEISDDTLKSRMLKGDTVSYANFMNKERPVEDQLFWALLMANKYKLKSANYDVYYILRMANRLDVEESLNSLDSDTRLLAETYLKRSGR